MKDFNFLPFLSLQRYKKWREVGTRLNHKIMEQVPREAVLRAAGDLRLRKKNNRVVFDAESDTHFLMDRVIHDISIDGRRVIELYRDQNGGTLTADELKLLDALAGARYSLSIVQGVERGRGLRLRDVFSNQEVFLTDMNLSRTAVEGHLLAGRMVSLDGVTFTTGCACPFSAEYLPQLKNNFLRLFENKRHQMTWDEMMRQYNTYFFISMKQSGIKIDFGDVV